MSRRFRRFQRPRLPKTPKIKTLQVATEVFPFSQKNNLGDIVASLSQSLEAHHVETVIVTPRYSWIDPKFFALAKRLTPVKVEFSRGADTAEVWEGKLGRGVRIFLLEHPFFLEENPENKKDNTAARFGFLSMASLDLVKKLGWRPALIHCHDWQTALLPYYLKHAKDPFFAKTKSILTIHNIQEQGVFPKEWVDWLNLDWKDFHLGGFEFYDQLNFLKAGIAYADHLTTLSPECARKIQSKEDGHKLDGLLKERDKDLSGIIHGINTDIWNPETDQILAQNFGADDFHGRRRCKAELQRLFRLPIRGKRPVLAVISPLEKHLEILLSALDRILSMGFQITFMLSGTHESLQKRFERAARDMPDRVGVYFGNDETLKRRVLAGADFLLCTSDKEPLGFVHLQALRYGTIPVAPASSGFLDTVEKIDPAKNTGTGFLFSPEKEDSMISCLQQAIDIYNEPRNFRVIQKQAMEEVFSVNRTAAHYRNIYYRLLNKALPEEESEKSAPVEKLAQSQNAKPKKSSSQQKQI